MDRFHRDDFGRVMVTLAETLREQVSDIAVEGYFSALRGCDMNDLRVAADQLAQTSKWFPKPAEWKEAARKVGGDRLRKALPPGRDETWHFGCTRCEDDGWICHVCEQIDCIKGTPDHERRMKPCPCRATNTTYQRRNQRPRVA